jgi:hypothetical protein
VRTGTLLCYSRHKGSEPVRPASAAAFVGVLDLVVPVFLEPSDRAVDDSRHHGCDKDEK